MTDKYYTPEIEEFHVGFEFFVPVLNTEDYIAHIFESNSFEYIFNKKTHNNIITYSVPDIIRVKFLDKEDIESFGFVQKSDYGAGTTYHLHDSIRLDTVKHAGLTYSINEIRIFKLGIFESVEDRIFIGDIKNKSELKKLITQLNIQQ